jgi:hypothetical protein
LVPTGKFSVVAITVVASYALLELNVRQVGDQLRENGSADIHHHCFADTGMVSPSDLRPFSVQIVFAPTAAYPTDYNSLTGFRKVLYRTLVMWNGEVDHETITCNDCGAYAKFSGHNFGLLEWHNPGGR